MSDEYRVGPIDSVPDDVQACFPQSGILHAYVWWASKTTHAPAWWHVGTGLTLLSYEAAKAGYTLGELHEKPALWAVLVGPSAAGKSTAIQRGVDMHRALRESHNDTLDPFVMAEGSPQGIFERVTDNWDHEVNRTNGIIYQEELSRLLDTKQPVAELLMLLSDQREIQRHKVSSRSAARAGQPVNDKLRNPVLSGLFASTYANLSRVSGIQHTGGGLYSRMLWFVDQPDIERFSMLPDKKNAERAATLREWTEWRKWLLVQQLEPVPRVVEFSSTVLALLEETLFETVKSRLKTGDDPLNANSVRSITHAYKIAALFALSQGRTAVLSDDMDQAVNCVERCHAGYERLAGELGANPIMKQANRAFRVIQGAGETGLTRTQLYRTLQTTKREVDEIVGTLIDEGSVEVIELRRKGPGRPSKRYKATGQQRYARDKTTLATVHALTEAQAADTPDLT